jgi:epoxyqueuosine reductase
MSSNSVTNDFISQIESYGLKTRIVSIEHIEEIKSNMENTRKSHIDINLCIGKYLDEFNYNTLKVSFKARSIIVIAVPQPVSRIYFTIKMKKKPVIMPPMYLFNTNSKLEKKQKKVIEVTSIVERVLCSINFRAVKINLPCKLLAVGSGLGSYGRNNICYIDDESSFYWIGVYISDMPCENNTWQENKIMDACKDCNLCLKNCPGGAIANDRFPIHADKCITLYNENEGGFPKWMNSSCHNSLIGCMRCQSVCPVNRKHVYNIEDIAEFDSHETEMILAGTQLDKLPETTYRKLDTINFVEDYNLLARNLKILISK